VVGQLHPTEQKKRDLKETYVMEMNLAKLLTFSLEPLLYTPVPRFPSISRDIALVVNRTQAAGELQQIIRRAGGKLLKDVRVFDLYEGDKMEAGQNPWHSP
jgi:phenylalanyl-tRNA synthetase beta chain